MNDNLAAKRYATALISVSNAKELEKAAALLETASKLFANKKFVEIAKSPLVGGEEKCELICSVLSEKPQKVVNLLLILAEKNRLMALPHIAKELRFALSIKQSVYKGEVFSQKPLAAAKLDTLAKTIAKRLGVEIKLVQSDKSYSGVKVAVDDLGIEVDFSKTQIKSQILGHILRGL